jgi:outer membrane immunogenic protein
MNTGKTFLATASMMAAVASAPAFGGGFADPVVEQPVQPVATAPAPRQTGNWGGFYAGGQIGYGDGSVAGADFDGGTLGAHAGYNFDLGGFVLGAEVDGDFARLNFDGGPERIDQIIRLKGRAGVDLGDTMLYGTAGVARARLDDGAGGSASDNGYFGGIGLDYALTDQIIVGGEALVHRFDNFNGGPSVKATTVRAKMSFRF